LKDLITVIMGQSDMKKVQSIKRWLVFALALAAVIVDGAAADAQAQRIETPATAREAELTAESNQKPPLDTNARQEAVVLLGASYVRAWPVQELGGLRVINKGVNGEQSFEMLRRFDDDVVALRPRKVVIWGFINDIHRTPRADIEAAEARVRESFAEMVRLARVNGVEPILATEVTIRGKDDLRSTAAGWVGAVLKKTSYQEYVNGRVLAVNRWIRTYAEEHGVPLLDFQPLIADEKGFRKKQFATEDGTHISPAAYERLTDHAKQVFSSLKKEGA
jgi:lysophospholipase L1-like esterase